MHLIDFLTKLLYEIEAGEESRDFGVNVGKSKWNFFFSSPDGCWTTQWFLKPRIKEKKKHIFPSGLLQLLFSKASRLGCVFYNRYR